MARNLSQFLIVFFFLFYCAMGFASSDRTLYMDNIYPNTNAGIKLGPLEYATISVPNDSSVGTELYKTASFITVASPIIATATVRTHIAGAAEDIIGIVVAGAGTTGNATIAVMGTVPCYFDGTIMNAPSYVIASTSADGKCKTSGLTYPSAGNAIGYAAATRTGAGLTNVVLSPKTPLDWLIADNLQMGTINTTVLSPSLDNIGNTRGSILYRGASGWAVKTPGTSGYFLKSFGAGADPDWAAVAGGDVVGPSSATDNAIARFDSTTGKLLQNSGATIDDSGNVTATSFVGPVTGNASTATALASNPSDCASDTYATTIAASGNLTCSTVTDTGLATPYVKADGTRGLSADWNAGAHNITATTFIGAHTGNSSTATALASNPVDCLSANAFANSIAANGDLTCTSIPNAATTATASAGNSTIVARDGSGNFAAGTITAALTGTASGNTTYTANQYGVVLSGSANAMSVLAPSSSTAFSLISGGASANPAWGLLSVAGGGTGLNTLTAHSIQLGNGASTPTQLTVPASGTILQGVASSDPTFTATPTLGVATTTKGTLSFAGNTSGTVTIQPKAAAGTWSLTLPDTAGTVDYVLRTDGAGITSWVAQTGGAGSSATATVVVSDVRSAGTNGGTSTSGSWFTRTLNTLTNPKSYSWVSLSSNQITLTVGRYYIDCLPQTGGTIGYNQARLQNITDTSTALVGQSGYHNNDSIFVAPGVTGIITIAGTKAFELQQQVGTTRVNIGQGQNANGGFTVASENFCNCTITKLED